MYVAKKKSYTFVDIELDTVITIDSAKQNDCDSFGLIGVENIQ